MAVLGAGARGTSSPALPSSSPAGPGSSPSPTRAATAATLAGRLGVAANRRLTGGIWPDFVTGEATPVPVDDSGVVAGGGHGGGDFGVIGAFADAIASGDRSLICTGPRESLDSHQMAFAAERSRLTGAPVPLT